MFVQMNEPDMITEDDVQSVIHRRPENMHKGQCGRVLIIAGGNGMPGAAVLAAVTVYPEIRNFIFPSVYYEEPIHKMQMQKLKMNAFLHYDFTEAEGFGSALGLSLLDAAIDMLNQMKTFGTANVDVAIDGAGSGRQRKEIK